MVTVALFTGALIEILLLVTPFLILLVALFTGALIEMSKRSVWCCCCVRRTLHGCVD